VKAEFHRPEEPDEVLATAVWNGSSADVESGDEELAASLRNSFRNVPVVVDDPSYRKLGTHGEVLLQPGDLEWFRAVLQVRVPAETGLVARLVPGVAEGGYDPASSYMTFGESISRLTNPQ
jgi:hypothetical protein